MGIVWFNEKPKDGIATLYDSNITLNKTSIDNLEDTYSVMLGINYEEKKIVIKPLNKEQDQRGDIPERQRYKITIRASYGRISNKEFMKEIQDLACIDLAKGPRKFKTIWDSSEKILIIDLNKREDD